MTGRILRIELLRSNARWLLLLGLLGSAISVGEAGRGLTVLALDQRQAFGFGSALVLGAAAWQARRDRRSRMDELLATTARPRWQRVLPATAALAIAAVVAYLVLAMVGTGLVAAAGGYLSAVAVPIVAVGALFMLVPVAFGLAIGRWLPFALVPPLAIVFMFVSLLLGDIEAYFTPEASGEPPGLMLLWGSLQQVDTEFDLAGITARTHLGQGLWAVALVAAGLIGFATARPRTRAAAIAVVVLGAAVAVPVLPDRYADAYYLDPAATTQACTADAPRVCVMRAHRPALNSLQGPAREALSILAAKLPDPPTSVVEVQYWFDRRPAPRADTIYVALVVSGDGRKVQAASGTVQVPDLRWELLLGAGTPGCANAPEFDTPLRRRYDTARLVAAAWLLDQEPPPPAYPGDPFLLQQRETLPVYQALRELPPDEQQARVVALREAELACDGSDRLSILTGP